MKLKYRRAIANMIKPAILILIVLLIIVAVINGFIDNIWFIGPLFLVTLAIFISTVKRRVKKQED